MRGKREDSKYMVILVVLVAVAAVGYGSLVDSAGVTISATQQSVPGNVKQVLSGRSVGLAATLMKIGVILVLSGVVSSLLSNERSVQRSENA